MSTPDGYYVMGSVLVWAYSSIGLLMGRARIDFNDCKGLFTATEK